MAGIWTTITPPNTTSGTPSTDTMILLTDGSVLVHNRQSVEWQRLTPGNDPTQSGGIYNNGNWKQTKSMSVIREYFASGVLRDGRFYIIGAEYSDTTNTPKFLNTGEIYDPQTGDWTPIPKPSPDFDFVTGDLVSCVLEDGRVLCGGGNGGSTRTAIWDPSDNNSWVEAGLEFGAVATSNKQGGTDEETWTLMPDGSVVTVEISSSGAAEKYLPELDKWVSANSAPAALALMTFGSPSVNVSEIGPAVLLPDGTLFAIGATGATAIYTPDADPTTPGKWVAGPSFPNDSSGNPMTAIDAPACLLPSGRVLCVAGSTTVAATNSSGVATEYFSFPTTVFVYDPSTSPATLPQLAAQPPGAGSSTIGYWTYECRFLVLPTGQVLFSTNRNVLYLYTPDPTTDGTPDTSWKPVISNCPDTMIVGHTHRIRGFQFNGVSQANSYGDDAQMATNYPIVEVTSTATGKVRFLPSFNFSTMGVFSPSSTIEVSCDVRVPSDLAPGAYSLVIIANGIASDPVNVAVEADVHVRVEIEFPPNNNTFLAGKPIEVRGNATWEPPGPSPVQSMQLSAFESRFDGVSFGPWVHVNDFPLTLVPEGGNTVTWEHTVVPFDGMVRYMLTAYAFGQNNKAIGSSDPLFLKSVS